MNQAPQAPATRRRILQSAVELTNLGEPLSMEAIARAAGVSRQTVYLHFGDKLGLLRELFPILAQYGGWSFERAEEILTLPALEAFDTYFRSWIRAACHAAHRLRPLVATLGQDLEVTEFINIGDAKYMSQYERLFAKLDAEGLLRSDWTQPEAVQAAWSMTLYLLTVGHMRLMRGWSDDEVEAIQMKILRTTFLNV